MENKYYMYVILCQDDTLYTGYSNDVFKRYQTHVDKKGAKYTKAHPPKKLLYYEEFDSKHDALSAEYNFKKLRRAEKNAYLNIKGIKI